eukprot:COSAG01_NODE_59015_length_302_cov_1.502463_1_plen_73_part_01
MTAVVVIPCGGVTSPLRADFCAGAGFCTSWARFSCASAEGCEAGSLSSDPATLPGALAAMVLLYEGSLPLLLP